jgi:hypothetical protein
MLRNILLTLSAAMVVALGAFAVSQGGAGAAHSPAQKTQEDMNATAKAKEARIVSQLGLTPEQKGDYDDLMAKIDAETAKMMALKSGHMEKGMEINKMLHAGLKKIFKPEQYAKWRNLWNSPERGDVFSEKPSDGTPFGGHEARILASLNLTAKQKDQIREHYAEMDALVAEIHGRGDICDISVNKRFVEGMQKIMTKEQYASYKKQWDAIMGPMKKVNVTAAPARRVRVEGQPASGQSDQKIAGKAGG